jgi:hypothetical protein
MVDFTMEMEKYPIRMIDENLITKPAYQREKVWSESKKVGLIDTILRGLPMQAIYIVSIEKVFGQFRFILDGQQRYETIMSFKKGEFKTAKAKRSLPNSLVTPVYPGLSYSELPPDGRSRFDDYGLPVVILKNLDDTQQGEVFRRLQIQEKLTSGEILYSMNTVAVDVLEDVLSHKFAQEFFKKPKNRKWQFQLAVMLMAIEKMYQNKDIVYLNLTTPALRKATQSISENDKEVARCVNKRLTQITHLFKGITFSNINHAILLYQAVCLLETFNANISNSPEGCLTTWYYRIAEMYFTDGYSMANKAGIYLPRLSNTSMQQRFWAKHIEDLITSKGVALKDQKRLFSEKQRISTYLSQEGRCAECGKGLFGIEKAIAHHVNPHSNGGTTTTDNLQLLCAGCHAVKHGMRAPQ